MTPFYKNLRRYCAEMDVPMATMLAEAGISVAAAAKWRNGAMPNSGTAQKLAEHIGVPVEQLLRGGTTTTFNADTTASDLSVALSIIKSQQETIRLLSGKIP